MTRVQATTALGMASQDIQPLVDAGFLRSFSNVIGGGPVGHRFLACDVQELLEFTGRLPQIRHAKSRSLTTFARNEGLRMGDAAVKVMSGELDCIRGDNGKRGFRALRVIC